MEVLGYAEMSPCSLSAPGSGCACLSPHTLLPLPPTICHLPGGSHQNRAGGGAVPLNLQNRERNKPLCSPLALRVKHVTAVTQSWLVTGPEQNRRQREVGSCWNTHRPCSRLSGLRPCPGLRREPLVLEPSIGAGITPPALLGLRLQTRASLCNCSHRSLVINLCLSGSVSVTLALSL